MLSYIKGKILYNKEENALIVEAPNTLRDTYYLGEYIYKKSIIACRNAVLFLAYPQYLFPLPHIESNYCHQRLELERKRGRLYAWNQQYLYLL